MKFFKNELMISHSNTKLNICQNVGPNELCIVFILSFFFLRLSVSLSLFTGKRKKKRGGGGGGGENRARTTTREKYLRWDE
jgi:hypothetical protein